ncbi:MAG: acyl-CoA dehydrogenase family protein, partial [Candidatus Nanopelagicales bacterium]
MTERMLPTPEAADLLALTAEIADKELAPRAAAAEAAGEFPREVFTTMGRAGLLALPYPEELGGGGQPYEVYLQVLEELAARWMA